MKSKGQEPTPEEEKELLGSITKKYTNQTSPYYAASRLWLDAIIDPKDTRKWISLGIEAANYNSIIDEYKTGVLQT
jgi:acetyl-CoA carboxylase carboxyltransferase component